MSPSFQLDGKRPFRSGERSTPREVPIWETEEDHPPENAARDHLADQSPTSRHVKVYWINSVDSSGARSLTSPQPATLRP